MKLQGPSIMGQWSYPDLINPNTVNSIVSKHAKMTQTASKVCHEQPKFTIMSERC